MRRVTPRREESCIDALVEIRESACARLTARQHGVLSRRQALEIGFSASTIDRRLRSGSWIVVLPGVYRLATAPASWMQQLWAAWLWAREPSAIWGKAAARLWDMDGFDDDWVGISCPRRLRPQPSIHVRCVALPRYDVGRRRDLPCTTPLRTVVDLGSIVGERRVERALEDCLRRGLIAMPRLRERLAEDLRGHRGVTPLRNVLAARIGPSDSDFEIALYRLLKNSNLPPFVPQFEIGDGARAAMRVDVAWPFAKIAVEAQSFRWHGDLSAWQRDIARVERLKDLGWEVIQVTWQDVRRRPHHTVERVRKRLAPRLSDGFSRT